MGNMEEAKRTTGGRHPHKSSEVVRLLNRHLSTLFKGKR